MSDTMTEQDLPPIRDRMCDAVGKHRKRIRDAIDDGEMPLIKRFERGSHFYTSYTGIVAWKVLFNFLWEHDLIELAEHEKPVDDTEGPWDRHPFLIDAEVM